MSWRFEPAVLAVDPDRRSALLEVIEAALVAADPAPAVAAAIDHHARPVTIAGEAVPTNGRLIVLALGKAASSMASGLVAALGDTSVGGVVVGPDGSDPVPGLEHLVGGHPVPDAGSRRAGARLLEWARAAGEGDLVVVLVSGGGSAMAEVPVPGCDLEQLAAITDALLGAGEPIEEINAVRRTLSALKGGGLVAAARPARVVTLAVSDVIGNPPEVIASGPTVAGDDRARAAAVLERSRIEAPDALGRDVPAESGDRFEVVLDGPTVASAAVEAAHRLGIDARVAPAPLVGEARAAGWNAVRSATPGLTVYWGETTVAVRGEGRGGRNQELALAAALEMGGSPDVVVAAVGTDGVDGPTPAAGAIVDGGTVERAAAAGLDPADHLRRNDSYRLLTATGDILNCGPTGTNVGDLLLVWQTSVASGESD